MCYGYTNKKMGSYIYDAGTDEWRKGVTGETHAAAAAVDVEEPEEERVEVECPVCYLGTSIKMITADKIGLVCPKHARSVRTILGIDKK